MAGGGILRFRRDLDATLEPPVWPAGFSVRTLLAQDAPEVHGLLRGAYTEGRGVPDLEDWWARLSGDDEFDPQLCFLAIDRRGELAGAALCWTGAFLKDLAVGATIRRLGVGESLLRHVFVTFSKRGAAYVDLKAEAGNGNAIRLYERVGMYRVPLAG